MLAYVNAIDFENDAIIAIAQIIYFDYLFVFIKVYTILSQFEKQTRSLGMMFENGFRGSAIVVIRW